MRRPSFFLLLLLCTIAACAAPGPPVGPVRLVWPEAPALARIEFERTIRGVADVGVPDASTWRSIGLALGVVPRASGRPIGHAADVEASRDARRVYVSDFTQGIIHVFDLEKREAQHLGAESGLARPFGIALARNGVLYVAEQATRRIRRFGPDGADLGGFPIAETRRPVDIALDETRNRIYVADGAFQSDPGHYVRVYGTNGEYLGTVGEGRGSGAGELLFPTYLAVGPDGSLYVADTMNARVSVFDLHGRFVRSIGGRGDGFGLFDKPKGLALDSFGNLFVVDSSWSNVQIFGPEGHVLLFFGGRGGHPGLLRNPTGIAIARDAQGDRIFVGDYLNRRLSIYRLVNTAPGDGVPESPPADSRRPDPTADDSMEAAS